MTTIPGYEICSVYGMACGVALRDASKEQNEHTIAQERRRAMFDMWRQAKKMGANFVIGLKFQSAPVTLAIMEITAMGTAVTMAPCSQPAPVTSKADFTSENQKEDQKAHIPSNKASKGQKGAGKTNETQNTKNKSNGKQNGNHGRQVEEESENNSYPLENVENSEYGEQTTGNGWAAEGDGWGTGTQDGGTTNSRDWSNGNQGWNECADDEKNRKKKKATDSNQSTGGDGWGDSWNQNPTNTNRAGGMDENQKKKNKNKVNRAQNDTDNGWGIWNQTSGETDASEVNEDDHNNAWAGATNTKNQKDSAGEKGTGKSQKKQKDKQKGIREGSEKSAPTPDDTPGEWDKPNRGKIENVAKVHKQTSNPSGSGSMSSPMQPGCGGYGYTHPESAMIRHPPPAGWSHPPNLPFIHPNQRNYPSHPRTDRVDHPYSYPYRVINRHEPEFLDPRGRGYDFRPMVQSHNYPLNVRGPISPSSYGHSQRPPMQLQWGVASNYHDYTPRNDAMDGAYRHNSNWEQPGYHRGPHKSTDNSEWDANTEFPAVNSNNNCEPSTPSWDTPCNGDDQVSDNKMANAGRNQNMKGQRGNKVSKKGGWSSQQDSTCTDEPDEDVSDSTDLGRQNNNDAAAWNCPNVSAKGGGKKGGGKVNQDWGAPTEAQRRKDLQNPTGKQKVKKKPPPSAAPATQDDNEGGNEDGDAAGFLANFML